MPVVKVHCGKDKKELVFPSAPVTASEVRARFEAECPGVRTTRVVLKGKTLQDHEAVPGGAAVLIVGQPAPVVAVRGKPPSAFVEINDVMNNIFTHLSLATIRLTCMRVCKCWREMAETETRNHPQRYTIACGELFDLFCLSPEQLLEPAGIAPESVVHWAIGDKQLFMVVSDPRQRRPGQSATHGDPQGAAAAAGAADAAGDDDGDDMSVDSDDIPDADLWPELVDALRDDADEDNGMAGNAHAGMGMHGMLGMHPMLGMHGGGAQLSGARPTARVIQRRAGKLKDDQAGYKLVCFCLMRRQVEWQRSEVFRTSRFPVAGLHAARTGVVVYFWDRLVLLSGIDGRHINDYIRDDRTSPMFGPPFLVATQGEDWRPRAARSWEKLLLPHGRRIRVLDPMLRETASQGGIPLPRACARIQGFLRPLEVVLYDTRGGTADAHLVCLDTRAALRGDAKRWWGLPAPGHLLHLSQTNVLWSAEDAMDCRLFDIENRNFHMTIPSTWGLVLGLSEGPPPDYFAEALFMLRPLASQTARMREFAGGGDAREMHPEAASDEAWEEMMVTDTSATLPGATNATRYPFCAARPELEAMERKVPRRAMHDSRLPMTHPQNMAARAYTAYNNILRAELRKQQHQWWASVGHSKLTYSLISRVERVDQVRIGDSIRQKHIERGLVDHWEIFLPFAIARGGLPSCVSCERHGKFLYLGLVDPATHLVGVYAVQIDGGIVQWRRLWQNAHCSAISISVQESAVLLEQTQSPARGSADGQSSVLLYAFNRGDGAHTYTMRSAGGAQPVDAVPPRGW